MNYTQYLENLTHATLFDLYRIQCAISQCLDDPKKQLGVKRHLQPGKAISYFNSEQNKLIKAVVVTVRRTRVLVQNEEDKKRWDIPFYMINLEGVDTAIQPQAKSHQLNKTQLSLGQQVGFHSKLGKDLYGSIIKLNPKNARVKLTSGETWRVAYPLLFPVVDGQYHENQDGTLLIEGVVAEKS